MLEFNRLMNEALDKEVARQLGRYNMNAPEEIQAAGKGQIEYELDNLHSMIRETEGLVDALGKKINSVMSPSDPPLADDGSELEGSAVMQSIVRATRTLAVCNGNIDTLVQRVEL